MCLWHCAVGMLCSAATFVVAGEPIAPELATLALQHEVVIVGETHRRPESARLFLAVVRELVNHGACPVVSLEISKDQQPGLDALARGEGGANALQVSPIIDHPGYRTLLASLGRFAHAGCVQLLAIDDYALAAPPRPETMFERLAPHLGTRPVLALVGNIHALQRIDWEPHVHAEPELGERLSAARKDVLSVLQHWPGECDGPRISRLKLTTGADGVGAFDEIFASMAASPPQNPREAADYVVIWDCP